MQRNSGALGPCLVGELHAVTLTDARTLTVAGDRDVHVGVDVHGDRWTVGDVAGDVRERSRTYTMLSALDGYRGPLDVSLSDPDLAGGAGTHQRRLADLAFELACVIAERHRRRGGLEQITVGSVVDGGEGDLLVASVPADVHISGQVRADLARHHLAGLPWPAGTLSVCAAGVRS